MAHTREQQYLRFLVERGAVDRWGPTWQLDEPGRQERIDHELSVIEAHNFSSYFIILANIMDYCREKDIPYGPGRGSVGGCLLAYLVGITEVDPLEHNLLFERFLNPDRVSYPDVDLDFSQERRPEILQFIQDTYQKDGNIVLQVAAFARAGARSVIDHMVAAKRSEGDEQADALGVILKGYLPEGNVTGGQKVPRELAWWKENGHGDKKGFIETATDAGWLDDMLKIDGLFTHLARHAAGVVILNQQDLANLPLTGTKDSKTKEYVPLTGFDMYDLDELQYLKLDVLGLRTLDVIANAHKFTGGTGNTRDLMAIWREHKDDPEPYQILQDADTLGIFQMETDGYRRTLRDFQPHNFQHIVQLNALYRPGALDAIREEDGKNMVEVFIDRHRGRENVGYPSPKLAEILSDTHGIILYQEQAMQIAQMLAGFTLGQADVLRKAIGKKRQSEMDKLEPLFFKGCADNGVSEVVAQEVWTSMAAAARYSWNRSHAVEYAIITWFTVWFKYHHPAAFYAALFNSYQGKKDRLSAAIAEARQKVQIDPPDINVAQEDFTVDQDRIVFGLNGLKGMGESNRCTIMADRFINGPYADYADFCKRLPSVPVNMKVALVRAGAFDATDHRPTLLSICTKPGKAQKRWTVAEHINHSTKLKKPRPVPPIYELTFPSDAEVSAGEVESIGFYISTEPLAHVAKALTRLPKGNHYGGEIEAIYKKQDRRGRAMATITLLTPALQRQRVLVFASVWDKYDEWLAKGKQVMIRGRMDGDTVLAEAFFEPDDVRQFKRIRCIKDGSTPAPEPFDGDIDTIRDLEAAGYEVRLVGRAP